ncbi:MAG: lycopene cyclase domain-containing protein [Litorilinea sp.]
MTYFGFLALFIGIPLAILAVLHWRDARRGKHLPPSLATWQPAFVIGAHVLVALIYTTPWDNYLVATRVWWYDPALVTGIVFGWVPLEEYTFFVIQTILTGMFYIYLARRLAPSASDTPSSPGQARSLRIGGAAMAGAIWIGSIVLLASGWAPGTYLGLEIVWAFPPIILQLAFGADIIWRYRRLVFFTLLPATFYLCGADALAIGSGTWTIDPAQSTGITVGILPLEEIVFFLLTNTLIVFGTTLVLAQESQTRAPQSVIDWMARLSSKPAHAQSQTDPTLHKA